MKSGYNIKWTDEALNNLKLITDYLITKWTERELKIFYNKLEKNLTIISKNPFVFPESGLKKTVRRSVLSKQTTIYYQIKKENVTILSLFDNRRDSKSIKL